MAGSSQFNTKPAKGIAFLQEQGLLSNNTSEIARFLHDNHLLDKGMIGDYIGDRKNSDILDQFIKLVNIMCCHGNIKCLIDNFHLTVYLCLIPYDTFLQIFVYQENLRLFLVF